MSEKKLSCRFSWRLKNKKKSSAGKVVSWLPQKEMAWLCYLLLLFSVLGSCAHAKEVYVVLTGDGVRPMNTEEVGRLHHSMLTSLIGNENDARAALLYNYQHSFKGFAVRLSKDEALALSEMEGVISVFKSKSRKMHTTRSWAFLESLATQGSEGTSSPDMDSLWKQANYGENIIIGVLDSGIWPESESFSDEGMAPVPDRWKGTCETGESFKETHCNRKIIGARYYLKGYESFYGALNESLTPEFRSPRDRDGHGTHTASTAAGRHVDSAAALGGFGEGRATGGAPKARLAVYKVCWPVPHKSPADENTCTDADMLAALDDAVSDGVDVLSISIGSTGVPEPYPRDGIAVGGLYAVKNNIVVVCSAGNEGPKPSTLSNLAPWLLTVGANSLDREFLSSVTLGNGAVLQGQTVTPYNLEDRFYPLISARDAVIPAVDRNNLSAAQCLPGSLDADKIKNKIVMCLRGSGPRVAKGVEVKRAGGAGVILGNLPQNADEISVDTHVLPGTAVVARDAQTILSYINSSDAPTAKIHLPRTVTGIKPAPFMAAFSSRGPNRLDPNILKPDMTAPGLNILAAWSGASSPTKLLSDDRRVQYNIMSGTSMSCPHVSGVSALIKAIHPDWSPAAIKSALMTTAKMTNNEGKLMTTASGEAATPFGYGAGQLNPARAVDPGLVYDTSFEDYLLFICASGIDASGSFHTNFSCPKSPPKTYDLNYPSIAVAGITQNTSVSVSRTLTNIGDAAEYVVSVEEPPGVAVNVFPRKMKFAGKGDKQSFRVKMSFVSAQKKNEFVFGSFAWSDGRHVVRSPIAVSSAL